MSHQDKNLGQIRYNAEYLKRALQWLLGQVDWSGIGLREDCRWSPLHLATTALLWAWSDEATLGERFFVARRLANHLYRPQREFATSWQAFIKLLRRWSAPLITAIQSVIRRRIQDALAASWTVHSFIVFGVDGSRVDLPRTKSHETVNGRRKHKRGKTIHRKPRTQSAQKKADVPQCWLTLLWHAGTGLPWAWRTGPTGSSEREHFQQMLNELPPAALIAADAGFVGYEHLRAVIGSGREVLVRVGSNVRLLRKLGWAKESSGVVYLWPARAAYQGQPPLVLRLVVLQGGQYPVYVVTSVRSSRLSDNQVGDLYRRRWGIELYFRCFKQTFQRRKLRSHCAENAEVEVHWSLLGLGCMTLYAQAQQAKQGISSDELSTAAVLRVFRRLMRDYLHPVERRSSISLILCAAVRDKYERKDKSSRDYPRKKHPDPPMGPPQIFDASLNQIQLAQQLKPAA